MASLRSGWYRQTIKSQSRKSRGCMRTVSNHYYPEIYWYQYAFERPANWGITWPCIGKCKDSVDSQPGCYNTPKCICKAPLCLKYALVCNYLSNHLNCKE